MTTVFPVQSGGWQPVADDSTITIGSTSGLTASEYLIHFGKSGSDYYVFVSRGDPVSVNLSGYNLSVNGSPTALLNVSKGYNNDHYLISQEGVYIDVSNINGGFQLTQRFISATDSEGMFITTAGLQCLNVSQYNSNKYTIVISNGEIINVDKYDFISRFLNSSFEIKSFPTDLTTSVITTNDNTLCIKTSLNEYSIIFKTNVIDDINYTIGGDTGIIISDDIVDGKSLTIDIEFQDNINTIVKYKLRGRTKPIIKFVDNNLTNVNLSIPSVFTGFVEPSTVAQQIVYKLKTGASGSPGAMVLSDVSNIIFDTNTKITIPETTLQPTLQPPTANQIFALNVESAPSLTTGSVLFSAAYIDTTTPEQYLLKPLLLMSGSDSDEGKYIMSTRNAVYLIMFKLGEQSGNKYPAEAQVIGKVNVDNIGINYIPTNIIQMGEHDKHQLLYINIGDGSNTLTVDDGIRYIMPYDTNIFRSADLKAAGVETWPALLTSDNTILCVDGNIMYEFSKDTENMFTQYVEQNTQINITNVNSINNYFDWSKLGFAMTDNRPTTKPLKLTASSSSIIINNIDDAILTKDYIDTIATVDINNYIQTLSFENIVYEWHNFVMDMNPFNLDIDTQFTDSDGNNPITIKPTNEGVYFGQDILHCYIFYDNTHSSIVNLQQIAAGRVRIILPNISQDIQLLEITNTDGYHYNKVGGIINNVNENNNYYIGAFSLSDVYKGSDIQQQYNYLDKYVFTSNKIGRINVYDSFIKPPTSITSETDIPDHIVSSNDTHQHNIKDFDLSWLLSDALESLTMSRFTPTSSHTIESSKDMTITLNNEVDWTDTNQLILKGGTWIVNDLSSSTGNSIVVDGDDSQVIRKGWTNKYLSQLGATSSIQKNLQTIYDTLGQTVNRVSVNNSTEYAVNVNGISDGGLKQLSDLIKSLMKTQIQTGNNKLSNYVVEIGEAGDNGYGIANVKFALPSKNGLTTKEITANISLNVITKTNDYYIMYYNDTTKDTVFAKTDTFTTEDKTGCLDPDEYDGITLKLVKTTSDTNGKLRLFFNNTVCVINTPLFANDFDGSLANIAITEQPSTSVNGRVVYNIDGIENLILVDTVNIAGTTIETPSA